MKREVVVGMVLCEFVVGMMREMGRSLRCGVIGVLVMAFGD